MYLYLWKKKSLDRKKGIFFSYSCYTALLNSAVCFFIFQVKKQVEQETKLVSELKAKQDEEEKRYKNLSDREKVGCLIYQFPFELLYLYAKYCMIHFYSQLVPKLIFLLDPL